MLPTRPHSIPSPPHPPPAADTAYAVLQAGPLEIRYRRAGKGVPVLLLLAAPQRPDALGAFLFDILARRCRVIAPEPATTAGTGVALSEWMRDVIDGLGLTRVSIVADQTVGVAALRFALTDPERVGRLIVVSPDYGDPLAPATAIGDALCEAKIPLLLLQADAAAGPPPLTADQISRLYGFLDAP